MCRSIRSAPDWLARRRLWTDSAVADRRRTVPSRAEHVPLQKRQFVRELVQQLLLLSDHLRRLGQGGRELRFARQRLLQSFDNCAAPAGNSAAGDEGASVLILI